MRDFFTDIMFEEKYLDQIYNQSYDKIVQGYLTKIDNLNTYALLRGL
jgi:hypothetical protein